MTALLFVSTFALSALATWWVTPFIRRRYLAAGWVDAPGGRKIQKSPVPLGGGLAVWLGFALPLALACAAAFLPGDHVPGLLSTHGPGIRRRSVLLAAILVGAALLLVMGRLDDRRGIKARWRFLLQLGVAVLVVAAGLRLTLFLEAPWLQMTASVLWLVFITNACNFIDNMDGLLAGCAAASTMSLAVMTAHSGQIFVCAFALALSGALLGFLPCNRSPARIYLGDEGSMFIGFLLGSLSILVTYAPGAEGFDWRPVLVPLLALFVPVCDAALVICTRILNGKPPWTPGRDHMSHRLEGKGLSRPAAVLLLWRLALGAAALALVIQDISLWPQGLVFAGLATLLPSGAPGS